LARIVSNRISIRLIRVHSWTLSFWLPFQALLTLPADQGELVLSATTIEWILGWAYLLLGPLAWGLLGFVMVKGRSRMRILDRPAPAIPQPPPSVSVLIPAKDEAGQIEKCVTSVLRQDYPNFDVIVIDDRSTDGTGAILDGLAAHDPRVRVVHLTHGALPPGWGGKSFALHNGLERAMGQWLLFVDADVQLEPDVMSATIAWAAQRKFDLISILPRFVSGTFAEAVLQPLAGAATSGMFLIALTNSPAWPKLAFANGQYLMVRRDAYEAIGGHEAIRGTLSEDVALARRLKVAGFRPRLGWGDSWATVRMYEGFGSIFRGWSRNFYVGSLGRPWRILGLVAFIMLCCYSAFAAIGWGLYRNEHPIDAWGGWGWIAAGAMQLVLMTIVTSLMYHWAGERKWYSVLLLPYGLPVLLAICAKSLWICMTGKVVWRGTAYTRDVLVTPSPAQPEIAQHAKPQRTV
jgi:chlorobactene glucosyltransferase